jgi:hypothetical protein
LIVLRNPIPENCFKASGIGIFDLGIVQETREMTVVVVTYPDFRDFLQFWHRHMIGHRRENKLRPRRHDIIMVKVHSSTHSYEYLSLLHPYPFVLPPVPSYLPVAGLSSFLLGRY